MKTLKKVLINLLGTAIAGGIYFYLSLPAINLKAVEFYGFFFFLAFIYGVMALITSGAMKSRVVVQGQSDGSEFWQSLKATCKVPLILCGLLVVFYLIGSIASGVFFRANDYKQLLTVKTGDFLTDVEEISYDQIPMLDKASAQRLGDRKLGTLSDMVSQFEVAENYTQINYRDTPVRVTPLLYGDLFKWFNNRSEGLPAYLIINMVTQEVEVVRLEEGMKYTTGEHFSRNLYRHLRFHYPTFMFDEPNFEINEEGVPYWVCPRVVRTIGLFGGVDIQGGVLVNAITGECEYYEEVPTWVDRLYSDDLIIEQYDYYGQYQNGFWNSMFGQKGVTVTTDGYNYMAIDDDVYMYTGVTSVGGDESNVGFILSNMRTKETTFYPIAGAEEYSAEASAEGVVQHLNYNATFPLLLNIHNQPTYFMALKDNAGLVKMYAMVNVQQYQIVATGNSVAECERAYAQQLADRDLLEEGAAPGALTVTAVIEEIRSAVIEGNTHYYLKLKGEAKYFTVSAADCPMAVILNEGDKVTVSYEETEEALIPAGSVEVE